LDAIAQPQRGAFTNAADAQAVAFSPNGQILVTAGGNSAPRLWDVATHRQIGTLPTGTGGHHFVAALAFSPNGKILATAGNSVRLWDVTTHRQMGAPLPVATDSFYSVAFNPSGKILATAGNSVRLWDVTTHRQIGAPITAGGSTVAFSPSAK